MLKNLQVSSYRLEYDHLREMWIMLSIRPGRTEEGGTVDRWMIHNGTGQTLCKQPLTDRNLFYLVHSPSPSSMDDEFIKNHRFSSASEAIGFWNKNRHKIVATSLDKFVLAYKNGANTPEFHNGIIEMTDCPQSMLKAVGEARVRWGVD